MSQLVKAHLRLTGALRAALTRPAPGSERGDVPGWVLITLMTAGLVAGDRLQSIFLDALDGVTGPGDN